MAQDHSIDTPLRRVTKPEACQILQVSLSTLNRRIAEGQLAVERVQQGQGHRVFVLLPADTDRPEAPEEAEPDGGTELAVAQERIRNLENMVTLQREWLDLAEARGPAAHPSSARAHSPCSSARSISCSSARAPALVEVLVTAPP